MENIITESIEDQGLGILQPLKSSYKHVRIPKTLKPLKNPSENVDPDAVYDINNEEDEDSDSNCCREKLYNDDCDCFESNDNKKVLSITDMNFKERMEHCLKRRKEELESIAMVVREGEKIKCPFTPQIKSQPRRNLNEFLKAQKEFVENKFKRIEDKKADLMEKEEKLFRKIPEINPTSLILCKRPRSKSNHRSHAKLEPEKLTPAKPKILNKSRSFAHKPVKTIKKTKEEIKAMEERKKEEINKNKKTVKASVFLKNRIGRELDYLINKRNLITYSMLCIIK